MYQWKFHNPKDSSQLLSESKTCDSLPIKGKTVDVQGITYTIDDFAEDKKNNTVFIYLRLSASLGHGVTVV